MREPPESHKQRFYKLPQLSWSWVATLIVYWGDFSSEGYYLHIRNSYTFKSSWRISAIFSALGFFRQKSFTPVKDLRLWDRYSGGVSGHHLSSTWRACYKLFFIGWKSVRCSIQLNTGYPVLLLSNRKNTFFSALLMRMRIQMFECQNLFTSMRKFWSICMLKYVKLRQHTLLKFSKKEGRRG